MLFRSHELRAAVRHYAQCPQGNASPVNRPESARGIRRDFDIAHLAHKLQRNGQILASRKHDDFLIFTERHTGQFAKLFEPLESPMSQQWE